MRQATKVVLLIVGGLLMSLPGYTAEVRWASLALLAAGLAVLVFVTVANGASRPETALVLLITSNLSFWLAYELWRIRLKVVGPPPGSGIDPFAGPVALWLILLLTFLLYEVVVFLRGIVANRDRAMAAIGLVAAIAQVLITIRVVYRMVQGV